MARTKVFRTIIAGGSAAVLVVAISPIAIAAGGNQGKSGDHGKKSGMSAAVFTPAFPGGFHGAKGLENKSKKFENEGKNLVAQARSLEKKLQKEGSANPAIATAVVAYKDARDAATTAFQSATKGARDAYQTTTTPASDIQKTAYVAAKTALQAALASATTDQAKQSAQDAYEVALKSANAAFKAATVNVLATYKTAVTTAQQLFNTALQVANLVFRQALAALRTVDPTATPSPTATQ